MTVISFARVDIPLTMAFGILVWLMIDRRWCRILYGLFFVFISKIITFIVGDHFCIHSDEEQQNKKKRTSSKTSWFYNDDGSSMMDDVGWVNWLSWSSLSRYIVAICRWSVFKLELFAIERRNSSRPGRNSKNQSTNFGFFFQSEDFRCHHRLPLTFVEEMEAIVNQSNNSKWCWRIVHDKIHILCPQALQLSINNIRQLVQMM